MSSTFASLAIRNYRVRFIGFVIGNIGTWMQRVAQDWYVLTVLTKDNGFAVGIVTALQFIPSLALAPVAGLVADRIDKRHILLVTQVLQSLTAFLFGTLILTGHAGMWQVFSIAFELGCVTAFDGPANQTFVGQLVPPRLIANAVSLNSASFNVARLVGPAVSGLLIGVVGCGWVFIINGCSFGFTIGALLMIRTSELHAERLAPKAKGQIREGFKYVAKRSDIICILVTLGVVSCLGFNSQLTIGVMARTIFNKQAGQYGILTSMFAVGALAGALMSARRQRPRVRLVLGAAFGFGAVSLLSGASPSYLVFGLTGILVGFFTLTLITTANSTVQLTTDPAYRGRVMSIYSIMSRGTTPIGSPTIGWVSQRFGPRWSIWVGALAALVVSVVVALYARRRWHVHAHWAGWHRPFVEIVNPQSDDAD
ncbi:MAG: MFS transporter [Bifidobacteriaceae bacterium]|jgi:MFS family permease|nr:MFS transporter [Bifidobacteriaceae bacterium]